MDNKEQVADTIEMLYERLNSYNKQDLFNYGYLLESNEILCKDIEEKDKEIERLNNIINELDAMFDGDLDGFFTINEKGSCNEIIEVIQNYKDKLKELKEGMSDE